MIRDICSLEGTNNIDFNDKDQVAKYLTDLAIYEPQLIPDVVWTLMQAMVMLEAVSRMAGSIAARFTSFEETLTK